MREARRGTCRRPNLRERHCRPGQCPPRPISSGWFALPRRWTLGQRPRHGDAITPISGRGGVWHRRARGRFTGPSRQYGRQTAKGGPAGASKSPGSGPPPRQGKYLPVLFDFEKPKSRNTDKTITLLARMARFVVADKGGVPGGVGCGRVGPSSGPPPPWSRR